MAGTAIQPHKITRAIQLPVVWIAALVILVSLFVSVALATEQTWMQVTFVVAALVVVLLFGGAAFLMQTKFRPYIQEDQYFASYHARRFENFQPENLATTSEKTLIGDLREYSWQELEQVRVTKYEQSGGIFLVHDWRPSHEPGQVADIAIRLHQHGQGPLSEGKVKSVEYHLGPKFFNYPVIETDPRHQFRLDVSAYGPMLCLARVHFHDGRPPLLLDRYIDFDTSLPRNSDGTAG